MSSIVYLKNKVNGKVYVYSNHKTWDSAKGKYVYRRKCIGHLDPVTGDIVDNREWRAGDAPSVRSVGVNMFLSRLSNDIGLTDTLQIVFPDVWKKILTCAFYMVSDHRGLTSLGTWMRLNETPFEGDMDLPRLLNRITDEDTDAFLRIWRRKVSDEDVVYTTVSPMSTSEHMWHPNGPTPSSSLIDLGVCIGTTSNLPISYEIRTKGVTTEENVVSVKETHEWLDARMAVFASVRGGTEQSGLMNMLTSAHDCTLRLPNDHPLLSSTFMDMKDELIRYDNLDGTYKAPRFRKSVRRLLNGKRVNIHLFYSTEIAEKETGMLLAFLDRCMSELASDAPLNEHRPYYDRYFTFDISEDGEVETTFNGDSIMEGMSRSGFIALASNHISDPDVAFVQYANSMDAERIMRNVHNDEDMVGLKLYIPSNLRNVIFLRFLSMILSFSICRTLRSYRLTKDSDVDTLMSDLQGIMRIDLRSRRSPLISEASDELRRLLTFFGMSDMV